MYIDNTITTEFTGYYDSEDEVYVYPSARQNLLLLSVIGADATTTTSTTTEDEEIPEEDDTPTPPSAYLSAMDGDFSTDGATFTHSAGESEDITIGNAISQVMSGTLLNPDGLLDGLAFAKNVKAFIGVETATESFTVPEGASAYVEYKPYGWYTMPLYAIGSVAYADGIAIRDMGEEIVSISALPYLNSTIYFWTASGACLYHDDGDGIVTPAGIPCARDPRWKYIADISTTGWGDFMQGKYANTQQSLLMDGTRKYFVAGSKPTIYTWDVENGTKTTWQYVPMGIFDMSAVSVSGFAYTFEAYDRMIAFGADATDWVQSLDFTNPKTVSGLVGELMTEMGFSYTIPASAVNTALTISKNPITDYSVSYRQILIWLAETMGCNVRMSRTGSVEFYTYSASPVMTITPDVIASQTREVSRYTIPQITRVVCYNTLGAAYTSGTAGQDYTILGNPFLDPSASTACIDNLLTLLSAIPAFNTTSFTDACADPRIDAGDFLTVERTDSTTYLTPVMNQTLTWRGMCAADYESTGNQIREVPSSEAMSAFEGTVNSNPSAVIAKIEAEGISADWITSGKLTVLDSNDNVIFDADKDTRSVSVAGFDVSNTRLHGEKERTSSGTTYTDFVNVDTDDISVGTIWNTTSAQTAELSRGALSIVYDTGNIENRETARVGNGAIDLQSTRTATASMGSVSLAARGGSDDIPEDEGMTFDNPALKLTAGMSGISSELSANTLRFADNGTVSSMRIHSLLHSSTITAETTYTKDIPYGTYLFLHSRQIIPVTAAQGAQLVVIGQTVGSSALVTLLAGGSDLTATSGTRSQVEISKTRQGSTSDSQDRIATVTWTVQGRSYRRLVMVRLM